MNDEAAIDVEIVEQISLVPVPVSLMTRLRPAEPDEQGFVVVEHEGKVSVFPVIQPPAEIQAVIGELISEAATTVITSTESDNAAYALSKRINKYKNFVSETVYALWRDRANKLHKFFVQVEKDGVESLVNAVASIDRKRADWVTAENSRRLKEAEEQRQEAERKRQAALASAKKKLEGFRELAADDRALLEQITADLNNPDIGDEEAAVMRAEMVMLEARLSSTIERTAVVEQKVAEVAAAPIVTEVFYRPVEAKGMKKTWVVVSVDWPQFLKFLLSGESPLAFGELLNKGITEALYKTLGKYVQTRNYPGVIRKEEDGVRH